MDLLLSLVCGALGGMALGGTRKRFRLGQFVEAGFGMLGGWLGSRALDYLSIGLAHTPAPNGALDPTAMALQVLATAGAGAVLVACIGQLRRLVRR